MLDKTKKTEQGGLNNLKSIYQMQSNGAIQILLRDLRASKNQIEDVLNKINGIKQVKATKLQQTNAENVSKIDKKEVIEEKTQKEEVQEVKKDTAMNDKNNSDNLTKQRFVSQPYQKQWNNTNSNSNRTYNNPNFYRDNRRPFNNNGQYNNPNGQRPYNNGQYNNSNGQRTYNNNGQRPFNNNGPRTFNPNGQRPFNNNGQYNNSNGQRTYNNNGQRPYNNGQRPWNTNSNGQFSRPPMQNRNNNFASSRANSFKKFEPTESIEVLNQPERNYGNKNKTKQVEEKKQINKKSLLRKNILNYNEDPDMDGVRMGSRKLIKKKKEEIIFVAPKVENAVITTENVSVKVLSEKTGKPVTDIIKQLMLLGIMATINSTIDFMTAELVAGELGVKLEQKLEKTYEQQMIEDAKVDKEDKDLVKRPPVVTVMGHVDHGKTSLLDAIRKTNVVSGEAGGITQKIGAYQIVWNNEKITFIDTPGHAAFTAMRARGAKVTDIAILVVAADDGVMPQTVEAINHIKAANVPMIVAVNKMDKPEANIDRVKQELADNGVLPEEWGGDAILVPVSAKKGVGIDDLLKTVLLVAEMQELKANANQSAVGVVIEAELDKNRGAIANVLIENGTLKIGDSIMSGVTYGKVRSMFDENGKMLKSAGPSTPVSILGLNEVPDSGDKLFAVDEKLSKQVIEERIAKVKENKSNSTSGVSLEDFMTKVNEGKLKALNIIIKADVQGSVEALKQSLTAIKNEEARVVCIHSGAGPVTESDLLLAQASDAVIINFNLKLSSKIEQIADSMKVQVKSYKIIYEVVDEITKALTGMLEVKYEEKVVGHAEVRQIFKLSTNGVICGSYILDGKAIRNGIVSVMRNNEKLFDTSIEALRIVKDDKAEVNAGYECGIKLKESNDVNVGDILEIRQKIEIKR